MRNKKIIALIGLSNITKDKVYDVVRESDEYYYIFDDRNSHCNPTYYSKTYFKEAKNTLPDEWAVLRSDERVAEWANRKFGTSYSYQKLDDNYILQNGNWDCKAGIDRCERKIISLELFLEEVYNEYFDITKTDGLKILGYKAPFDLYGGRVKKGTMFQLCVDPKLYRVMDVSLNDVNTTFPKEIVETWEPVYIFDEKIVSISKDRKVKIKENRITADGYTFNIEEIRSMGKIRGALINGLAIEIQDIKYKIGCWEEVTLADIELVISEYEKNVK